MQPFDLSNYNNTDQQVIAGIENITVPPCLKANLQKKQLRISKFYLNNSYIPQFIPRPFLKQTDFDLNLPNPNTTYNNNTLNINSTCYYFAISNNDPVVSTATEVYFISHIPENTLLQQPLSVAYDEGYYYGNPYYYYHDFKHFLSIVQNAINSVMGNNDFCTITLSTDLQNVEFLVNQQFLLNHNISFSKSLLEILPLKNFSYMGDLYNITFSDLIIKNNNKIYQISSCKLWDTVFPFCELLITEKNLGTCITNFVSDMHNSSGINNETYNHVLLAYDISTNNPMCIYNFYKYVNTNNFSVSLFNQNTNDAIKFSIFIYLRMKDGTLVQHKLNPRERFQLTFQIEEKKV